MTWEFAILDRKGIETIIDEPIGWDSVRLILKRDEEWHGVFFEAGGQNFQYVGDAMRILKDEFERHGADGNATLIIRQQCAGMMEELERYRFLFIAYEYVCGDYCYVTCPVETNSEAANLRNKYGQKVDLETTKAFDGKTALPPYAKLPFDLELPSKAILLKNNALLNADATTPVLGVALAGTDPVSEFGALELCMNQISSSEIGSFAVNSDPLYKFVDTGGSLGIGVFQLPGYSVIKVKPLNTSPIVNFYDGSPGYNEITQPVDFDVKSKISIKTINGAQVNSIAFVVCRLPVNAVGDRASDYEWLHIDARVYIIGATTLDATYTSQYTNPSLTLNKGDRIYSFWTIYTYKGPGVDHSLDAFELKHWKDDSYWKMTTLTKTKSTVSKAFMVNETLSRISEAITNDSLRGYSYYFGRTDSQPYAFGEDGCGSLQAITDGLRVRRAEEKEGGNKSVYSVSLQEAFEGLNSIHNIGMGIEPDENRDGYNRLRFEPSKHFYSDDVILVCSGIKKITTKINRKHVFSSFQFGYQKWEAEEYTGLDEFLTKRNYRTKLDLLSNTFAKLCKFIASGYASEITRRKGNLDSKDWRYDKETFVYCLKRGLVINSLFVRSDPSAPGSKLIIPIDPPAYNQQYTQSFLNSYFAIGQQVDFTSGPVSLGLLTVTNLEVGSFGPGNGGVRITVAESINPTFIGLGQGFFNTTNDDFIAVELGGISSPENMIDPDTIYNFRISPIRNALRWFSKVAASYKYFDINSVLLFTDGDGNYFSKGKLSDGCSLERIAMRENEQIDLTKFDDPVQAQPYASPERKIYEYPMSTLDFKNLKKNPRGLIRYEGCETGEGWIDQVEYKAKEGVAEFTLIKKIN